MLNSWKAVAFNKLNQDAIFNFDNKLNLDNCWKAIAFNQLNQDNQLNLDSDGRTDGRTGRTDGRTDWTDGRTTPMVKQALVTKQASTHHKAAPSHTLSPKPHVVSVSFKKIASRSSKLW